MSTSFQDRPSSFLSTSSMRPIDINSAHYYDKVISVITKKPSDRSNGDISQIKSWFQKKSDLFNQLNDEIIHDLVKNCEFMKTERDFLLIEQGEKGDCFFIILHGSVSIYINTTLELEKDLPDVSRNPDPLAERRESMGKVEDEKIKELDRSKYGIYVGEIGKTLTHICTVTKCGKSFGELALINADSVRNATIITDETTDLIVIGRDLYNRCIKSFHAKEFAERKQFVESNPLFDKWHPKYKKQLAMSLKKEKFHFESVIIKQGTRFDGLRFIISGQAKVISDPFQHSTQYSHYYPLPNIEDLKKEEARESLRRELSALTGANGLKQKRTSRPKSSLNVYTSSESSSPRARSTSGRRSPLPTRRQLEFCLVAPQEILGDFEVAMNLNTFSYSITCMQETEIYVLNQTNFERLIEKRNPQVINVIKNSVMEKYSVRMSWMKDKKDIPLFRYLLYKTEEKERRKKQKK
ncbi:Hypothetical predicted protein [Mytilus galloprovincialis]|uniref:Cyclic nucleotide-binding domain-containing protein n=1 Tax=Mytilus galloprovincialis TaxID=29158 RepID=A0A8B6DBP1_MYTGA|nr:Hypothetical predicted protein [Mytilus galloprovincialis]